MKDVNQKEKINSAKSVSFDNQDGQKVSLYAGAANFGLPLNLGLKVRQNIYMNIIHYMINNYQKFLILLRLWLVLLLQILLKDVKL